MKKSRLEAFSDGVLAIIITIMVLELHVPHEPTLAALCQLWPVLLSYLMSYVFIGIYWNNHHHLWQVVEHVNGPVLWANLHLLLWLSLVPFVTAWMGENHFAAVPVAVYGVVLLGAAIAYYIMTRVLLADHARDSLLARALGSDFKGRISVAIYAAAIVVAFRLPWLSGLLYGTVSVIWLVPDRRVEKVLAGGERR
ncbi:MAG TPA: TMEM175 family protein [Burkholderiaceae bacterium]|nr:TMEM175 family protein [Burkholderiaceae bacterium]